MFNTCYPAGSIISGGFPRCHRHLSLHPVRGAGRGPIPLSAAGTQEGSCDLDAEGIAAPEANLDLLALDAALDRLAEPAPLKARLVDLRYFAGLTGDQAAAVLGLSASSADRPWVYTHAWLRRELGFGAEF